MKLKAIEISSLIALVITVIMTVSFENSCEGVREKVLRLHVIANSDSVSDQNLKYTVRDEILREGECIFYGSDTASEAREEIRQSISLIRETALRTVKNEGFTYNVDIDIGKTYFPTREYENIVLPAGYYDAVRVIIGEGKGKNWWCVMFPPMCLPSAKKDNPAIDEIMSEKELDILTKKDKYELRFWFVEKYYEMKEKFRD